MIIRRISLFATAVLTALFCLCGSFVAYADSGYSLTVNFITESGNVSGSDFTLYYAMSPDGTLSGAFADLNVVVGDLSDSENVNDLAFTLASYANDGDFTAVAEQTTDSTGSVKFTDLSAGIYLATGTPSPIGDIMYTPKPILVRIPGTAPDGTTLSDVVAEVKYDRFEIPAEPVSRTVTKVWEDNDDPSRPDSVSVTLLCNGEDYDTVALSAANDWTYTWDDLDAECEWQVVEDAVPNGYTVSVSLENTTFTVTNKSDYQPPESVPDTDTDSDSSDDDNNVDTDNSALDSDSPVLPGGSVDPNKPQNPPKLPQTGQLWWPVPVLFALGIVLLLAGIVSVRLSDENESV